MVFKFIKMILLSFLILTANASDYGYVGLGTPVNYNSHNLGGSDVSDLAAC